MNFKGVKVNDVITWLVDKANGNTKDYIKGLDDTSEAVEKLKSLKTITFKDSKELETWFYTVSML